MTAVVGAVEIVEAPRPTAQRSPADVLRLAVATGVIVAALLVQWLAGDQIVSFMSDLLRGLDAISPDVIGVVAALTWGVGALLVIAGLVSVVAGRRWRAAATVLVAAAIAAVAESALTVPDEPTKPPPANAASWVKTAVDAATATEISLAVVAAMLTAAAPWIPRLWRRLGWVLIIGLVITRAFATPVAFSSLRGLLTGWFVGAAVVVALGAPPRRPRGAAIAQGLAAVGVPLRRLEQASLDARGSTPYFAVAADGSKLFVKVLGTDERSADLLFRAYRAIVPRNLGDERGFRSLRRAVEHEALLALAARDLGVRTPHFVAFATADPAGFVLAYEAVDGRSLDRVDPAEVDDAVLRAIWEQVLVLRAHRVAHRDLRLANIFLAADGRVWIIDFGFSELSASDTLLGTDLAELLASSALQVGDERAVAVAAEFLDASAFGQALGRLRPWALAGATRSAYKARPGGLEPLRRRVTALR